MLDSQGAAMQHRYLPGHYDLLGRRAGIPWLNYLLNWPPKMYERISNVRVEVNIGPIRVTQLSKPQGCGWLGGWLAHRFRVTAAGWH